MMDNLAKDATLIVLVTILIAFIAVAIVAGIISADMNKQCRWAGYYNKTVWEGEYYCTKIVDDIPVFTPYDNAIKEK